MILEKLGSRNGFIIIGLVGHIHISNAAKEWKASGYTLINNHILPEESNFYYSIGLCITLLALYGASMSIRLLRLGLPKYLIIVGLIGMLGPFAPWIPIIIPVAAAYLIATAFLILDLYICFKK